MVHGDECCDGVLAALTRYDYCARSLCAKAASQPCTTLRKGICANKDLFEANKWTRSVRGRANRMGIAFGVAHHLDFELVATLLRDIEAVLAGAYKEGKTGDEIDGDSSDSARPTATELSFGPSAAFETLLDQWNTLDARLLAVEGLASRVASLEGGDGKQRARTLTEPEQEIDGVSYNKAQ